jgi:2-polyprenyl-3-methyl-5-hydroxy-6-metoxy-1,4-benzoquinol methylase
LSNPALIPCPICAGGNSPALLARVNLIRGPDHDLVQCPDCGVIHFEPLPTADELEQFYAASYFNFDRSREQGNGMAFASRLRRMRAAGRLLDVGCATGFFIDGIRKRSSWQVYGVDFGESAVRFARDELGLEVAHGELVDVRYPEAFFDVIRINNVLEHVRDPLGMLRECRRIIRPNGRLLLSVPNGFNDSRELIAFHREEGRPARSHKGHIFFFPAPTLLRMFDNSGFVPAQKKTHGFKRGLRNLGVLPRKKHWKRAYELPAEDGREAASREVAVADTRSRPAVYYRFALARDQLTMIPGLHRSGLDFMLLLEPAAVAR